MWIAHSPHARSWFTLTVCEMHTSTTNGWAAATGSTSRRSYQMLVTQYKGTVSQPAAPEC
jgi:hypothetical protein